MISSHMITYFTYFATYKYFIVNIHHRKTPVLPHFQYAILYHSVIILSPYQNRNIFLYLLCTVEVISSHLLTSSQEDFDAKPKFY